MHRDTSADTDRVTCLWCESDNVEQLGEFGPGLMTAQWFCRACRAPFERIRTGEESWRRS